jgi:hypothetical protein
MKNKALMVARMASRMCLPADVFDHLDSVPIGSAKVLTQRSDPLGIKLKALPQRLKKVVPELRALGNQVDKERRKKNRH